ncbi:MAG: dockerin type I repeat-containing protein [Oscillospiraceae bacterium]|nr:dockerin type I repeat-containing protein [Oscillospiraceae bacterium]
MNERQRKMDKVKKIFAGFGAMLLAFALIISSFSVTAFAAETEKEPASVDIYFSVSHDAGYFETPENEIIAFKKLTVPYFDLALYGLQQYYFSSESYGKDEDYEGEGNPESDIEPGTSEGAFGKVTMLHALIYATEIYYCGIDAEDAGKGYLKDMELIGTNVFSPEGSTGSMYIRLFWGMDENFNYYHNYKYPLASEGWGSTADQILLHDGDIVTLGHFSNWSFHQDSKSVFNFIKAGEKTVFAEVEQNKTLDLTAYLAGKGGNYTTSHTPRTEQPGVYYISLDELDTGIVTRWNFLGSADKNGNITFDAWMESGEYLVCVSGQYGAELKNAIVSTPGGIIVKVTEASAPGDINGDGTVNVLDLLKLRKLLVEGETEISKANADLNSDGNINVLDLLALRKMLVAS